MNRYTGKALEKDIIAMNQQLESIGSELFFVIGYRYNYTAIDLATKKQLERHCCHRNLETGTPRECLAAANQFIVNQIKYIEKAFEQA